MPPVVVSGEQPHDNALVERSFQAPDDLSGFGESIDTGPAWRSFQSMAEILGESVGAQVRREGGRDDFATLSIRGAPPGQVRILLDGISLGQASTGIVNLADLPIDTVERIDIYRGFAPVALSPQSAAGVVNVVTRDPKNPVATFAAGGGSFGSGKLNAGGAGPVAGGAGSAFASWHRTNGDFDFVDDNGSLHNPDDDSTHKRRNNQSDTAESLLRWHRDITDWADLQLRDLFFWKNEGVPGLGRFHLFHPKAELETTREIAVAALRGPVQPWSIEQNVSWKRQRLRNDEVGSAIFDNTAETTATTTAARWSHGVGKSNWLSLSSDYTWEGFDQQADDGVLSDENAHRSTLALAGGDDWTLHPLPVTLSFQLREQLLWNDAHSVRADSSDSENHTDPRFGLRWQAADDLVIKSNVASYFRPPTFDELYGVNGFTEPNPGLQPETGITWDAGFEWNGQSPRWGRLAVGYAYFGSRIDDGIIVMMTFSRQAQAQNVSRASIHGHEARVEWQGPAGFALSANYTFQKAINQSDPTLGEGHDLASLPPHEVYSRLSWTHGLFVIAYSIDVASAHYNDLENQNGKIPTRTVHDVTLVYGPFWKGLRMTLQCDNLANSLVPDEVGFPLPGRSFFATLSWSTQPEGSDAR
ncbi:MAG TPA: TonB-dependent receptor [Candidatus Binatia bacterium]